MAKQRDFTSVSGAVPFTAKDRDGYEETVFDIDILLQFHANGKVFGREEDDTRYDGDVDIAGDHDLAGTWHVGFNDVVRFDLKRVRPARERENEIPGDGSDYYAYPTVATVACLADGFYAGVHANGRFVLIGGPSSGEGIRFELLGEVADGFPAMQTLPKLDNPKLWATFQYGPYTETHQWTPDDEPHDHTQGFCLRMHADNHRVEVVITGDSERSDLFAWPMPMMVGTWSFDPKKGYLIDLEMARKGESDYQFDIKASRYLANFHAGKLCLRPIREGLAAGDRGPEERFYDLPPLDHASVWLPSVEEDPLTDLREQFERDKEEGSRLGLRSLEQPEEPPAPALKPPPMPRQTFWDRSSFQMIFSGIVWIVLIWLAFKYFG